MFLKMAVKIVHTSNRLMTQQEQGQKRTEKNKEMHERVKRAFWHEVVL